ncbi:hypothetical protein HDK64DRAFT_325752 [Phyllosticta capitalensis]
MAGTSLSQTRRWVNQAFLLLSGESAGSTSPLLFATNTLSGRSSVDGGSLFSPAGRAPVSTPPQQIHCLPALFLASGPSPARKSVGLDANILPASGRHLDSLFHTASWTLLALFPGSLACWEERRPLLQLYRLATSAPDPPPRHRLPIPSSGQGCLQIPGGWAKQAWSVTGLGDRQRSSSYFGTLLPLLEERWPPIIDSRQHNWTTSAPIAASTTNDASASPPTLGLCFPLGRSAGFQETTRYVKT